jgi:hypothetical protein
MKQWTKYEDAVLRREYPKGATDKALAERLGRKPGQIKRRRNFLGLERVGTTRAQWSPDEEALLRQYNAKGWSPAQMTEILPGRSLYAIRRRREVLGLPIPPRSGYSLVNRALQAARAAERKKPQREVSPRERLRSARARAEAVTAAARERYRLDEPPLWERL